jgi:TRAP-type mannitol/chloroaromatic compound transport system permease small subunit
MKDACKHLSNSDKWIVALIIGLLFLLIASPFMFTLVNTLTEALGLKIADSDGCPNTAGLILHTLIFIVLLRLLMR